MQPAITRLNFALTDVSPTNKHYFDIGEALSRINRRGYAQGRNYVVAGVTIAAGGTTPSARTTVACYAAGSDWVTHNAYEKALKCWKHQQLTARDPENCGILTPRPKWEDFKVYLDEDHEAATNESIIDGGGNTIMSGEWIYSSLLYETDAHAVQERSLNIIGPSVTGPPHQWGLILEYQQARATVQADSPNLPGEASTGMYAAIVTDDSAVSDEVIQNMEDSNDDPPYSIGEYVGGDVNADVPHLVAYTSVSGASPIGRTEPFQAPCGVIMMSMQHQEVDVAGNYVDATEGLNLVVSIDLVPGPYKGVLAPRMGQ